MENYRLIFAVPGENPSGSPAEIVTGSASAALLLAQRHGWGRPVEVWKGQHLICRVAENADGGYWEIS